MLLFITECVYQYLRQPPSNIRCNPYSYSATLAVQCQASVPVSETTVAEIQWFYNNQQITNASFLPLRSIEVGKISDVGTITSTARFDGTSFNDDSHSGNYFCQIRIDRTFTAPSSNLTLELERKYILYQPCRASQIQVVERVGCARNTSTVTTGSSQTVVSPSQTWSSFQPFSPSPSISPILSSFPSKDKTMRSSSVRLWVYTLVALVVSFAVIIVIMSGIVCVLYHRIKEDGELVECCHILHLNCWQTLCGHALPC